jgi:DNA-binding CsgD family transcriptional regulator
MWKPIRIDNELTVYSISTLGEVRNDKFNRLLKLTPTPRGYVSVRLCLSHRQVDVFVHVLVMEAYAPIREMCCIQVNHNDGNKSNNDIDNLEWVTPSENIQHAFDTGLASTRKGMDSNFNTYPETAIMYVCELLSDGIHSSEISKIVNIPPSTIRAIRNRYIWKDLSKDYEFPTITKRHTENEIRRVCELIQTNHTTIEISNILNINKSVIKNIRNGYAWRHISLEYNIIK